MVTKRKNKFVSKNEKAFAAACNRDIYNSISVAEESVLEQRNSKIDPANLAQIDRVTEEILSLRIQRLREGKLPLLSPQEAAERRKNLRRELHALRKTL